MSGIRLVISDFDRTFTDETLEVGAGLAGAIRRLKEKGVSFSIVSGRNYDFLDEFCKGLGGLVSSFVAENGCIGQFGGRKYVIGRSKDRDALFARLDELSVPYGYGEVIAAVDHRHEKGLIEALSGFNGSFDIIKNVDSLMILPRGVSKASGAWWLAEMHGVCREEMAAIGDAENDVHLRDACGLLGAVANAIPAMKDVADYVCGQGYGKGLQEFLEYVEANSSMFNH